MALPTYDDQQNTPAPQLTDVEPESVPDEPAALPPMEQEMAPAPEVQGEVSLPPEAVPVEDDGQELPDMAEGAMQPRAGVGMLAGIGDFLGKLVNRGARGVQAPPGTAAAVAAEKARRVSAFAGRLMTEDTITVGEKTIKIDLTPLGADGRQVDLLINAVAEEYRAVLTEAKRGKISDKRLAQLATETGLTEDKVLELVQGDIMNAERVLAARRVLGAVALRVMKTRDELKLAGALEDPEGQQFFFQQLAALVDVESRVRGVESELGRALRATQLPVEGLPEGKRIAAFMKQVQDPTGKGYKRFLKLMDEMESPEQVSKFAELLNTVPNAYIEIWLNMLLSGPATHAANIVGNFMATANGIVERLAAGGIGAVRRKLTGADNGVYLDEGIEMLLSSVSTAAAAFRAAKKLAKTGERTFGPGAGKFDLITGRAITAENFGASGPLGWGIDAIGGFINLPMKGLMVEDEFFKVWNFQLGLRAEALRQAKIQGLRGKAMRDEMGRIMNDPITFKSVFEAAEDYGKYTTFNRELGKVAGSMRDFSNAHPVTKIILPFVTAPANLAHYTFERLPILNLLGSKLRKDLMGKNGAVARDLAMAKVGVGATASAVTAGFVMTGYITGRGPLDPNVKRTLEEAGWQPYSIWDPVTQRYVAYDRTDPLGMFIGTVADATQLISQLPQRDAMTLATAVTVAVSNVLLNKTYVRGFAALVDALESSAKGDLEGNGGVARAWQQYLASHVPSAVAAFAREIDPVMRDVQSLTDRLASRVPGYSKDLPAVRDLYGRPRLREGLTGWAPDLVLPFRTRTPKGAEEPGLVMIVENGISITPMSRTLVGPDPNNLEVDPVRASKLDGVQLTAREYDRWGQILEGLKVGGKTLKEKLDSMAEDKELRATHGEGPESRLAIKVKGEVLKYRKRALLQLMRENDGAVMKRVKEYYRNKRDRARLSRSVEAEEGSSVDAGGVDISAGVQRLTP